MVKANIGLKKFFLTIAINFCILVVQNQLNMNTKALLAFIAFLAFSGLSFWWWNGKRKECCGSNAAPTTVVASNSTTSADLPLSFNWNSNAVIQGNGFSSYKNEKTKNLGPTDTLIITTWYNEGETNGKDLALQRANAVKALFPNVDSSRIKVVTDVRPTDEKYKTEKFVAADFSIIANQNSLVKRDGNKITIYFASNSSAKNVEKEIDDYLNTLVADMKANPNEKVTATGFTDNVGDDAKNLTLSQTRADFVKTLITQKGANAANVTTMGKGEADPIATNDTEEGRKLNRRVELNINN
jgi:outer membrane protein OmpA-like peptidoglycan-associated protein